MSNQEMESEPREWDAVAGGKVSPPVGGAVLGGLAGIRSRLASQNLEAKISAVSDACKYGEAGFELLVELMRDESIERSVRVAGQHSISSILKSSVVTDDVEWYSIDRNKPFTESKVDTLKLACDRLLNYIESVEGGRNWYLDGGISYIFLSPIQDLGWSQGRKKPLNRPLKYLTQILSAEKLRRVRIINFMSYCSIYYDISEVYKNGVREARFKKDLENKLLNQSVCHSLLPLFEEYLTLLVSCSSDEIDNLVLDSVMEW